ncbi:Elongation factor 1-beta [Saguinus oedipus]|uniref:Elongation factor 1-beta n=1 Tax=Saguinus oedipus TaxID=9490 RepID=A0ABQ9UZH3_SAGOE|nr:Elongation factor 1-beta [Saguinus oedipus]
MGLSQQLKSPWIVDCAFVLSQTHQPSSIVIRPEKPASLQVLNDDLVDKSYIKGYVPSQADVAVFEAVSGPPPADLSGALSWYNYTKSYEKKRPACQE